MSSLGSKQKLALIPVFRGTNCHNETKTWLEQNLNVKVEELETELHEKATPNEIACVVIPGGFSYGDYLRAGALAARDPKLQLIQKWAKAGTPVMGICNGFQILCEAGLLPGVLLKNTNKQHNHINVALQFEDSRCVWIPQKIAPCHVSLPISCGMGAYLSSKNQVMALPVFRYLKDWNGSEENIAGVCNVEGNVFGLMPHPERASDPILGSVEGLIFLLGLHVNRQIPVRPGSALQKFKENFETQNHSGVRS
jgi:phosphoribosylformylglycinamidine synthase subunit PurQ / glutaminase